MRGHRGPTPPPFSGRKKKRKRKDGKRGRERKEKEKIKGKRNVHCKASARGITPSTHPHPAHFAAIFSLTSPPNF
jgi:hypothetical protein